MDFVFCPDTSRVCSKLFVPGVPVLRSCLLLAVVVFQPVVCLFPLRSQLSCVGAL